MYSYVIYGIKQDVSPEAVLAELPKPTTITKIVRVISAKTNQPTSLARIFSALPITETSIVIGDRTHRMEPSRTSAPRFIICSRCQRDGHVASACSAPITCPRCGGHHLARFCQLPKDQPVCCHCSESHPAFRCPTLRQRYHLPRRPAPVSSQRPAQPVTGTVQPSPAPTQPKAKTIPASIAVTTASPSQPAPKRQRPASPSPSKPATKPVCVDQGTQTPAPPKTKEKGTQLKPATQGRHSQTSYSASVQETQTAPPTTSDQPCQTESQDTASGPQAAGFPPCQFASLMDFSRFQEALNTSATPHVIKAPKVMRNRRIITTRR